MDKVICPYCDGTARIWARLVKGVLIPYRRWPNGIESPRLSPSDTLIRCIWCDGSGRIRLVALYGKAEDYGQPL